MLQESVSELDDWRKDTQHENSAALTTICENIDAQHFKIMRFTRQDIEKRWKDVDKELKKMQLLRVKVIICKMDKSHVWLNIFVAKKSSLTFMQN